MYIEQRLLMEVYFRQIRFQWISTTVRFKWLKNNKNSSVMATMYFKKDQGQQAMKIIIIWMECKKLV